MARLGSQSSASTSPFDQRSLSPQLDGAQSAPSHGNNAAHASAQSRSAVVSADGSTQENFDSQYAMTMPAAAEPHDTFPDYGDGDLDDGSQDRGHNGDNNHNNNNNRHGSSSGSSSNSKNNTNSNIITAAPASSAGRPDRKSGQDARSVDRLSTPSVSTPRGRNAPATQTPQSGLASTAGVSKSSARPSPSPLPATPLLYKSNLHHRNASSSVGGGNGNGSGSSVKEGKGVAGPTPRGTDAVKEGREEDSTPVSSSLRPGTSSRSSAAASGASASLSSSARFSLSSRRTPKASPTTGNGGTAAVEMNASERGRREGGKKGGVNDGSSDRRRSLDDFEHDADNYNRDPLLTTPSTASSLAPSSSRAAKAAAAVAASATLTTPSVAPTPSSSSAPASVSVSAPVLATPAAAVEVEARVLNQWWIGTTSTGIFVEGYRADSEPDAEQVWHSSTITTRQSSNEVRTKSGALYRLMGALQV
jgi:hypothetical protein